MKGKKRIALFLMTALALALTTGCSASSPAAQPSPAGDAQTNGNLQSGQTAPAAGLEPIRIGNLRGLTGSAAQHEMGAKIAIDMMAEEINAQGGLLGRPIEIITYDVKDDVAEAVNAFKRLCEQDKVVAICHTAVSNVALATGPIAESFKVPSIGAHLDPRTTVSAEGKLMNYMFMCQPSADMQGKMMADYVMEQFGHKTIGVMYDSSNALCSALAQPFIDAIKEAGGTTYVEIFQSSDTNYLTQLNKLKAKTPEAYYFPVFTHQAGVVCQQARQVGIDNLIVGSVVYYPAILDAGAASEENVIWPFTVDFTQPGYDEYAQEFEKRASFPLNPQSQMAADGFTFIIEAIKKAGSAEPEDIKKALEGLTIEGWQGKMTMDPDTHQPAAGQKICVVNNIGGKLNLLEVFATK